MRIEFQCQCGKGFSVEEQHAGRTGKCPACGQPVTVPIPAGSLCPICRWPLGPAEPTHACGECRTRYHRECWEENGGCAIYGCSRVPETRQRDATEIPVSFWGQEEKQCPSCGATILAAARRCAKCGAEFKTARPESDREYRDRKSLEGRAAELRRKAIWLFVTCMIPFVALFASIVGYLWYAAHREEIKTTSSFHSGLCVIGLSMGAGQSIVMVLMGLLYSLLRAF
jgi:DNA-directed RNA polymerase subunit RPC12/RpoP